MWAALAGLAFVVFLVWLVMRLAKHKGAAELKDQQQKDSEAARKLRDDIEANVFGLPDDDLECLRKKWSKQ